MRVNYQNAEQPTGVAPGEYEVVVCAWDVRTAKTGNACVILDYEVRRDVAQPCAGMKVRYDNFTFTETCSWRFSQAAMAAGVPDGYELNIPEDFGKVMYRRCLRITVNQAENEKGKKYSVVESFTKSKFPLQQPPLPAVPDVNGFMPAPEEGLPFN